MSTLTTEILAWRDVRARLAPYAAIPLRLIVGYGFLAHGLTKWFKGPEAFAGILHATGVPLPHVMAWVTIATEIVCGIAFLIGAFVPLVSIPAIILLGVAIFTVHLPYGFSSIKLLSVNNGRAQFGPPGYASTGDQTGIGGHDEPLRLRRAESHYRIGDYQRLPPPLS